MLSDVRLAGRRGRPGSGDLHPRLPALGWVSIRSALFVVALPDRREPMPELAEAPAAVGPIAPGVGRAAPGTVRRRCWPDPTNPGGAHGVAAQTASRRDPDCLRRPHPCRGGSRARLLGNDGFLAPVRGARQT